MANALKCDRCGSYFDYDPSAKFNFIAFGHKDIIVGKNFPVKDICPNCMEQFTKWFENPDNYEPNEEPKPSCHFANCKFCASLIHERIPGEDGIAAIRCGRKHKRIELSGANPDIIDAVTPEIFDEIGGKVNEQN